MTIDPPRRFGIILDEVLVPVKLTDAMRERMAKIEDGPSRSYDEVWAEMLDAALIQYMLIRLSHTNAKTH